MAAVKNQREKSGHLSAVRRVADPLAEDSIHPSPILRWSGARGLSSESESLSVEAPLAVEVAYERHGQQVVKTLGVTMRTPGEDDELALGFLHAEGVIAGLADVRKIENRDETVGGESVPTRRVHLVGLPREDLRRVSRGLMTTSACGLCGRSTLAGLPLRPVVAPAPMPALTCEWISSLPDALRAGQNAFRSTGGCHGAALAGAGGALLLVREDVGRHNAVDKLVGTALRREMAFADKILVLSGRASFELVQKASAAGIPVVVAVGAPSSLAVGLAHGAGITLIGFARGLRFNVYAHADRIDLAAVGIRPAVVSP